MTKSRIRVWILAALACLAIGLFVASRFLRTADSPVLKGARSGGNPEAPRTVAQCVEAVVAEYNIPRSAVRIVPARPGVSGQEMRLRVDPGFSSYEFHSALAGALAGIGASVVGTESMKTKSISLQIMKEGAQVMLVILDLRLSPQQQGKESRH